MKLDRRDLVAINRRRRGLAANFHETQGTMLANLAKVRVRTRLKRSNLLGCFLQISIDSNKSTKIIELHRDQTAKTRNNPYGGPMGTVAQIPAVLSH